MAQPRGGGPVRAAQLTAGRRLRGSQLAGAPLGPLCRLDRFQSFDQGAMAQRPLGWSLSLSPSGHRESWYSWLRRAMVTLGDNRLR